MKLAIVGNCQVDPLRHVLLMANRELHVTCFNINHARDKHKQETISAGLSEFDFIVSQVLHNNFGDLSSTEMRRKFSNFLAIPNIFFLGWHPDMTYLGDENGRVVGPTGEVHSVICAVMADSFVSSRVDNRDVSKFLKQFDTLFDYFMESHDSFNASKTALRKRFEESDLGFLEFEKEVRFLEPFMLTHNHPTNRALVILSLMILKNLGLASQFETQQLIDFVPNPLTNQVMWSPIHSEYANSPARVEARNYYAGKGIFFRHEDFVVREIKALTSLRFGVPSLRRPDIPKSVIDDLCKLSRSL